MPTPPRVEGPTSTPVNWATIEGPETKATASAFMTTASQSPSISAGPERTGPVTAASTGTVPEQAAMAAAAVPQPWRASTPSDTSAPLEESTITKAVRCRRARRAAAARLSPSARPSAPRRRSDDERASTTGLPPTSTIETSIEPSMPERTWNERVVTPWLPSFLRCAWPGYRRPGVGSLRRAHPRFSKDPQIVFNGVARRATDRRRRGLAERGVQHSLPCVRRPGNPQGAGRAGWHTRASVWTSGPAPSVRLS